MLGGVVVALAVELTGSGQLKSGLKMLGNGLVEQRALGVARVEEFELCSRLPARMRMRLRWACSGGHGAVPAWAGSLRLLCLYTATVEALAEIKNPRPAQFVKHANMTTGPQQVNNSFAGTPPQSGAGNFQSEQNKLLDSDHG